MNRVLSVLPVLVALAGCRSDPIPEYRSWLEVSPDCWTEDGVYSRWAVPNPVRLHFQKEPLSALPATASVEYFFVFTRQGPPPPPDDEDQPYYERTAPVRVAVDLDWHTDGDGERAWTRVEFEHEGPGEGQSLWFNVAPDDSDFAAQRCASHDCGYDDRLRFDNCQDYWDAKWNCFQDAEYRPDSGGDCSAREPGDPPPP